MRKTINMTYDNFIKTSDQGFRTVFKKMGFLGDVVLTANGGSGYNRMFDSFKKDVQNKVSRNQVQFVGSSNRPRGRANLRVKRRSLMKAKRT